MARQINLDDLPRYSPHWVNRLLGLEKWQIRSKVEAEVIREFEVEKWGALLRKVAQTPGMSLSQVEELDASLDAEQVFFEAGEFWVGTRRESEARQAELLAESLLPHLAGANALVELGAGYGARILALSQKKELAGLRLQACELTRSGQELIRKLAEAMHKDIEVGYCDFRKLELTGVSIPEGAVIFTSYSVHYVPQLSADFVGFLARLKPRAVVHFEPCYEHYSTECLHGLMCRRYTELNDYTRNLVTILEAARDRGEIGLRMRKNVLGDNPFLPVSVLEWTPAGVSGQSK